MKKVTKNLEIEKLKKEVEEYKNKYLRALADYQNFEKRVKEERNQLVRTANLNLIMKLLPFLDSLEKAEVFIKDQGLKIAKDHLFQSLKEIGIEEIDVVNKPFNPKVAEAIDIVQGDKDDVVVEVLRKGYRIEDKILRVAQVKVS
ncbi:nucleotide exchange factor GrpE, partial [Candidatus Roizmanbacteria bacterium CG11_big_fil_rev_8_21_14_0_20_35_14]